MEEEPKTTTAAGNKMTDTRGINGNKRDGPKGEKETPVKGREGVVNPRETSGCQQKNGDTSACIKPPYVKHYN
jgi:hypothetical protein